MREEPNSKALWTAQHKTMTQMPIKQACEVSVVCGIVIKCFCYVLVHSIIITLFSLKSAAAPLALSVSILIDPCAAVDRSAQANLGEPGLVPALATTV